jgi:pyruvate kinase
MNGAQRKAYAPRTRIVCTLGPASSSETVLRHMMRAGMDIVRLNFSHGNRAGHASRIQLVRSLNRKMRRHVRLLGDLEGPRIRMGYFPEHLPIVLHKRQPLWLVPMDAKGRDAQHLPFDYAGDYHDMDGAAFAHIDDGNIVLQIKQVSSRGIETRVEVGGLLKERKAVNFPGAALQFPLLSEKDARDVDFAVEQELDFLALSFVRRAADVQAVRDRLGGRLPECRLIAKIESQEGIDRIDEILDAADGVMVARGDMGVCVPIYQVPLIQKRLLRLCGERRKLSITATQMLESMVENRLPTRAEVSDVANAVLDGTDCVMLSAETAVGKHPVGAVDMMNRIIKYTELGGAV